MRFVLTTGQAGDAPLAGPLIEGIPADVVIADTAYNADHFRLAIVCKGALAVIPNNRSRASKYLLDTHLYFFGRVPARRLKIVAVLSS